MYNYSKHNKTPYKVQDPKARGRVTIRLAVGQNKHGKTPHEGYATQTNQESCTSTSPHEVHTEQGGFSMAANCQERLASSILAERILLGAALFNCNNNGAVGATVLHTRHAELQAHVHGNAWKTSAVGN